MAAAYRRQTRRSNGHRETRRRQGNTQDIVAALVYDADFDDLKQLAQLLQNYRSATVGDLFPDTDTDNVLEFRPSRPGPR